MNTSPFSSRELTTLLPLRREIVVCRKKPGDPYYPLDKDFEAIFWKSHTPIEQEEPGNEDSSFLINVNIRGNRISRHSTGDHHEIFSRHAFIRFMIEQRTSLRNFDCLLDVKSIFFLCKNRLEKLGARDSSQLARKQTLAFLDAAVKHNERDVVFLRTYLISCAINMEMDVGKIEQLPSGKLEGEILASLRNQCKRYYSLIKEEIEYLH